MIHPVHLKEAKRDWQHLMKTARRRSLTQAEKKLLKMVLSVMRRASR